MSLKGIQFVSDAHGKKTGIFVDLRRYNELWEDIYDMLLAETRKNEPRIPWKDVKRHLKTKHKQHG